MATEGQLSKSLRHICSARPIAWDSEKLRTFIIDFWSTVSELLPAAFATPDQHVIQKGPGFASLHRLLPNIAASYVDRKGLKEMIEGVDPYFTDAGYWAKGGDASQFSSEGGYKILAEKILEAIRNKMDR